MMVTMTTDTPDLQVGDPDDLTTVYRDPARFSGSVPYVELCQAEDSDGRFFCTRHPHSTGNHAFGNGVVIKAVWS